MAFHTCRIEVYGKAANGNYNATATDVIGLTNANVSYALGEFSDGFSFSVFNYNDSVFDSIKVDDKVLIYGSLDGVTESLLIDGIVQQKSASADTDNHTTTINGLNRLEKLFNALVSTTGEPVQRPASYWIANIIDQINEFNSLGGTNRSISYSSSTIYQLSSTYNISFVRGYEKGFKLIEELSRPDLTDGRVFIYWLDTNNVFHWQPRSDSVDAANSLSNITFGTTVLSHKTDKGMFDLVNYIIMNAGKSPYGATILQVDYDVESINKYGWKVKLISNEDISSELRNADRRSKPANWTDATEFPTAYPYLTVWGQSASSDSDYNSKFVDKCLIIAAGRIAGLLQKTAGASFKSRIGVSSELGFALGDLTNITIPEIGWSSPHTSRLDTINMSFNREGWTTDLSFVDDSEFSRTG
jgi:hypothetical protein